MLESWRKRLAFLMKLEKKSSEIVKKACLHADSENQENSVEIERKCLFAFFD